MDKNKKEILFSVTKKDFDITYFSGSGAGGQHRNKHQNCVRMKHRDSGIMATGTEQRSRDQNLKSAFLKIANNKKFRLWLKIETSRAAMGINKWKRKLNEEVDEQMAEKNLKIEFLPCHECNGCEYMITKKCPKCKK